MRGIRRRTWVLAVVTALLIHGGAGVVLLWQPPAPGAESVGTRGVAVGLAVAGAPPGADASGDPALVAAEAAAAESAKTAEAVETGTARAVEAEPVTVETVEGADATAAESVAVQSAATAVPPEAPPESSLTAEPVTVDAAEADVADAELPEPDAKETAAAAPPPPARPVRTDPEPRRARPAPPRADRTPPAPERTVEPVEAPEGGTEIAAAPVATVPPGGGNAGRRAAPPGSSGRAGSKAAPETGDGPGVEGGGSPGERADFLAQLQAWLERHKEYPRRAQRRRQEGTALLYFAMSRDGRVLDFRIEESSGHEVLDREVQAMIRRAQPLPAMPASMRQSRLELVVPVVFSLR